MGTSAYIHWLILGKQAVFPQNCSIGIEQDSIMVYYEKFQMILLKNNKMTLSWK